MIYHLMSGHGECMTGSPTQRNKTGSEKGMTERLFVCGTLAPGRPNAHILAEVPGSWEPASVTGTLRAEGWGAAMG